MAGLGGQGGVERLAHAGEGGFRLEFGPPVGPFQLEGRGRQARLVRLRERVNILVGDVK